MKGDIMHACKSNVSRSRAMIGDIESVSVEVDSPRIMTIANTIFHEDFHLKI